MIQASYSQLPDWNYCDGNIWTPDNSNLYDNQIPLTSGIIKSGDSSCIYGKMSEPATIRFAWKKSVNLNPAYYINYSFYIGGVKRAQCNATDWMIVALPIESGEEMRWKISLDSGTPGKRCPNFASGSAWIANISYTTSNCTTSNFCDPKEDYGVSVMPEEGTLNDSYTYNISIKNISDWSILALEIQNPHFNRWESFGEGKRISDNLIFRVPGLSFIKPPFLGDLKFRFRYGNTIIGPFTGPTINLNLLNMENDPLSRTLSMDVIANMCTCDICLNYDGNIQKKLYSGCGDWEKIKFENLNKSTKKYSLGVCNA